MSLTAGIVGLPNVGKSTLFNAITKKNILAANYPFATIDPNVGVVTVPDKRVEVLENMYVPERTIPTTYEFTDIAGLVKGASTGEGLGNKFLSHIRQVDAIVEVVRCFDDENIIHVDGNVEPIRDIEVINVELVLSDLEIITTRIGKIGKKAMTTKNKDDVKEIELLERIKDALSKITYPIYHLDFESYNSPLPRFFGERPYEQSLFQYSLHKEIAPGVCDLVKDHTEFLAKDHQDHRKELAIQLISDIDLSKGGCVMVYNKSFEKTRLRELAMFFPEYKEQLDNINNHIFDLLEVLKGSSTLYKEIENQPKYTYYNNDMHGSFSIKKVLPIFTNLSYSNLEVKNGTEAIVTYGMLDNLTKKEYEEKYLALRVYCRQDTWAMVEILRGLRKLIKEG